MYLYKLQKSIFSKAFVEVVVAEEARLAELKGYLIVLTVHLEKIKSLQPKFIFD